jgi:hypothetical protein
MKFFLAMLTFSVAFLVGLKTWKFTRWKKNMPTQEALQLSVIAAGCVIAISTIIIILLYRIGLYPK